MDVLKRNNVKVMGSGRQPILFAHGFGCDQNMWRFVAPEFTVDYQVVLFDYVGAGKSDATAYVPSKYRTLQGYAQDVLDICEALDLQEVIFVGHSVSAMIGVLAAKQRPDYFAKLILIGPSACYINKEDYVGGFEQADIDDLLVTLESNYLGWSQGMAPAIMGNAERPALGAELTESFCRMDPDIAKQFARATFLSDNRADLPLVQVPSLVMQCREDIIAQEVVGEYVHQQLPNSQIVYLQATGHCPNLSAPEETVAAIRQFLNQTESMIH